MQIKTIDWKQTLYHLFKLSSTIYALYDDEMDMPVKYGSLSVVNPTIESIKKHVKDVFIVYYDRDLQDKSSFKKNILKTRVNNESK